MKALNMDDNAYNIPRATFELLADCVNRLCEFPEVELAEVANREGYAPGCAITVWSASSEYRIEIDGETGLVGLVVTSLDGHGVRTTFSGPASESKSWLQIQCLILTSEGYENAAEMLREHGIEL